MLASAATLISIDLAAGGGSGSVTGIDSGRVVFVGGGLWFDWQAFAANSLTLFTASGFTRFSGGSRLSASISIPSDNYVTMQYGAGADTIVASAFASAINATTNGGNDFVIGTSKSDGISTGDGNDILVGLGGDDSLNGDDQFVSGGNDILYGGDGDDYIAGGPGNDVIQTGGGIDWVLGDAGNDDLSGGAGPDRIRGGEGDDHLDGNAGVDDLDGEAGSDSVFGGSGDDYLSEDINQTSPGDALHGGDGDDFLQVNGGVNTLFGDGGNDQFYADLAGIDDIQGGGGNDTILASIDSFGFYYFNDPTSLTRQQILDLLFSRGITHDIVNNEPLEALIS